jgi:diaminopimelate decarboxylase
MANANGVDSEHPHLAIRKGTLRIGGVDAKTLAEAYGTPLYVTELDRVSQRYHEARAAIADRHRDSLVAFAYKSNSTRAVVKTLSSMGAGATVVSLAGLELAMECGVATKDIVFDGPSKTKEELATAIRARVGMINAESVQEVQDIETLCARFKVRDCRVGFRVNFGIKVETHAGLATGSSEHKFGVAREEVIAFCEEAKLEHLKITGLHSHIGSQLSDPGVFKKETEELVELATKLRSRGVTIREFNFGGGLGVSYRPEDRAITFDEYAEATAGRFAEIWREPARLVFELGRAIVADSTVLLTRVNYLKRLGHTNWALVDAGMNDFLRPALYDAYHRIVAAHAAQRDNSAAKYDIGGPVCESSDVFGSDRALGVRLRRNDILAILDVGAYGISMASHYNMRPIPAVVVLSKGRHRLAQRSKTFGEP